MRVSRPSSTRSQVSSEVGTPVHVAERAGRVERGVAVERGTEEADGVGRVGVVEPVAAQHRTGQLGVPRPGARGRGLAVEGQPGGGVAARVLRA